MNCCVKNDLWIMEDGNLAVKVAEETEKKSLPPALAKIGIDGMDEYQSQKFESYRDKNIFEQCLINFNLKQKIGLILALTLFLTFVLVEFDPDYPRANEALAGTSVVAIFWIFEVIPVPMTSILPLILFPILGVNTSREVAGVYYNDVTFLFIGAFLIVIAAEDKKAHKRFALNLLTKFGSRPKSILLGFMVVSGVLSMFASNTSTTIMLVPIVQGLLDGKTDEDSIKFTKASLLGIAYGATSGGIATLVGTVPNAIFAGLFKDEFPEGPDISFVAWFGWAAPISFIMLFSAWGVLVLTYLRGVEIDLDKETIRSQLKDLGPIRRDEIAIGLALAVMIILFLIRPYLLSPFIGFCIDGVNTTSTAADNSTTTSLVSTEIFGVVESTCGGSWSSYISDGTIACLAALILFFVPSLEAKEDVAEDIGTEDKSIRERPHKMVLTQKAFFKIRWDILLLFGAGFALANAFNSSGLSLIVGEQFRGFADLPDFGFVFMITFVVCFLTEIVSNTATVTILVPILLQVAVDIQRNPLLLGLPATVATSLAFMLPIATPPNTVVYASGKVTFADMMQAGFFLNLIGIMVVTCMTFISGNVFEGILEYPPWAP